MAGPGNQSTLLNIVTFSEFTDLTVKKFVLDNAMIEMKAQPLFIFEDLAAHTGNTRRYDEVDVETYASVKNEGSDASKASAGVGYNMTMTAKRVAKEIDITWEMRRYNKYPQVTAALTSLSHFGPQRADLDLTHRLTFVSSTAYTDMDGVSQTVSVGDTLAVASTVHTLAFSSSTYSNRLSGDPAFSQGALENAEILANTNILSNFGEKRTMNFNTIISSNDPSTVRAIRQVLESTADVDASHAGVTNTNKGRYRHVILPNLATTAAGAYDSTKRRWWFIASIGMGPSMSWQAYYGVFEANNLKTPAPGNNGEDVHNDNWTYGSRMSYGNVVLSGRGIICSLPTS